MAEKYSWADQIASEIIKRNPKKKTYVCASGITPSGTIHIGNFREVITTDLVVKALEDNGKKVRFVYLLKGRPNQDGLVVDMDGQFLVPGCFIIPSDKDSEMSDIFKQWEIKKFTRMVIFK